MVAVLAMAIMTAHTVHAACQVGSSPCGGACCPNGYCSSGGFCNSTCSSNEIACWNSVTGATFCTDVSTDPSNCGSCNIGCVGQCVSGVCGCTGGRTRCPFNVPDASGANQEYVCVDLTSDPLNCGQCNIGCVGGNCTASTCAPPFGRVWCPSQVTTGAGYYTDLDTDPANCGSCYNQCMQGVCSRGTCFITKGTAATTTGASSNDVNLLYEVLGPILGVTLVFSILVASFYFTDRCKSPPLAS